MNTDKIISIAKKLDQQGKFKAADEVFSRLVKIAQITQERPGFVRLPGRSGSEFAGLLENTDLRTQEFLTAQDFQNAKHLALNRVNAMSNSLNRILNLGIGFRRNGQNFPSFSITPDLRTKLQDYWSEIKTLKKQLEFVQTGTNKSQLNVVDTTAEEFINGAIKDLSEFASIHGDLLNSIRNMFRSDTNKRIQDITKLVAVCEAKLAVVVTGIKLSPEFIEDSRKLKTEFSKSIPLDQQEIPVAGWEMPKEFKVTKLPDSAPDIFGGTVQGSKGEVNRNVKKLSTMDDKDFADSYQLYRERIEKAFIANENKFSESEKANYENEMQSLKDRYYTILYRDKPKASFTD